MSKSFTLYNQKIEFSEDQVKYNKWKLYYESLATRSAKKYFSNYERYGGLDEFCKNGYKDGWDLIAEALRETTRILTDSKKDDLDANSLLVEYGERCFSNWEDTFYEIYDKYMEIVLKSEELDAYRIQRRRGRGQFIGGGFGIEGAMKGIATAEFLNMASGAIHGTINLVGKGFSKVGSSLKKSNIYNSENTKQGIWDAVYGSIYNLHYVVCEIFGIPSIQKDDIKFANDIYKDIVRMRNGNIQNRLIQIIKLNPHKEEAYKLCIEDYGDRENEVQTMANYFGIDVEPFKKSLLNKVFEKLDFSSEESTLSAKSTFQEYRSKYGLQNSTFAASLLGKINTKLQEFEREAKTIGGEVFASRKEANIAAQELAKVKEIVGNDNYTKSEEEALATLEELQNTEFKSPVVNEYINDVQSVVSKFDLDSRTYKNEIYATKEEAELAKFEDKELQKIVDSFNTKKLKGVLKALDTINNRTNFRTKEKNRHIAVLESTKKNFIKEIKEYEESFGKHNIFVKFLILLVQSALFLIPAVLLSTFLGIIGLVLAGLLLLFLLAFYVERISMGRKARFLKRYEKKAAKRANKEATNKAI